MAQQKFQGSMVALVTPMKTSGAIDWRALEVLLERQIEQGTDAIIPTGTTGESATLDVDEHLQVVQRVIKRLDGRCLVVAGTGANATNEAIFLTKRATDVGADCCLLVTPYYNKPTQHGLCEHYLAIAEAVDVPQLLYNVPGRTACDLLPETAIRLASHPRIVGIKEASGDVTRVRQILSALSASDDFVVLSGEDGKNLSLMREGAGGCISVTANVAPKLMADFCHAAIGGDFVEAERLDAQLTALHQALFVESNPIPTKWALQELGLIEGGIRLPLTPLSVQYEGRVRAAMATAGISQ